MPCAIRCPNVWSTLANNAVCLFLTTSDVAIPKWPTTLPTKLSWSCLVKLCHCMRTIVDIQLCGLGYSIQMYLRIFLARQSRFLRRWRDTWLHHRPNNQPQYNEIVDSVLIFRSNTHPNGMIGVIVRTFGKIQLVQWRRIIRTAALVIIVHSPAVALEVGW